MRGWKWDIPLCFRRRLAYVNHSENKGLRGIKQKMKEKDSMFQPDFLRVHSYCGLELKSPQSSASEQNLYCQMFWSGVSKNQLLTLKQFNNLSRIYFFIALLISNVYSI